VRQPLIAICLLASAAAADKTPPKSGNVKAKPIDVKAVADKLAVYRDDTGMYYVSPRAGAALDDAEKWVFYGDGKTLYQQRVIGSGSDSNGYDFTVWAPRVRGLQNASLVLSKDKPYAECKLRDGKKPLTQLTADEAKSLFQRTTFLPPLWQRTAHFLARDEDGVYYFVDELREEYGGNGHRVFIGQKGAMKEQAMTNVVSDSAGEIYATKAGDLKIITQDGKAFWKKGGAKAELVVLELLQNRYLIYRELGIYGQLGIVCDDQ
jgi:hypothetical protein